MRDINQDLLEVFRKSGKLTEVFVSHESLWLFAIYEDVSDEEIELLREQIFLWKVVKIAKTSYLCFSPSGYSWNEVALLNSDQSQNLEELLSYRGATLPIRFVALRQDTGEVFTDRDFQLDIFQTENLISAVKSQQYITQKEINDLDFLGDPTPLLKAIQSEELPNILGIDVNQAEHTVQIRVNSMPKREFKEPRARWILRHYENMAGTEHLRIYTNILEGLAEKGITHEWKHCLIPVDITEGVEAAAQQDGVIQQLRKLGVEHLAEEYTNKLPNGYYPAVYAALMLNWRYSKGIYNFDSDVLKSIYLASLPLNINARIFTRLPEFCIYAKTPGMTDWNGKPIQGFFAMTEEVPVDEEIADLINEFHPDTNEKLETETNLYLLIDGGNSDESRDGRTYILQMPLDYENLRECLEEIALVEPRPDEREPDTIELIEWVTPFLSQLLYLCSEEPEIEHSKQIELQPETETVKKTKKGLRIYAPSRTNEWLCGWRTGSFIKQQKARDQEEKDQISTSENTKTVRGHLRRAHWHTFYAGKRNAPEREVRVKWLQMIKVNFESLETDKLPAVVKKVK
jgi:hypothetical protein